MKVRWIDPPRLDKQVNKSNLHENIFQTLFALYKIYKIAIIKHLK